MKQTICIARIGNPFRAVLWSLFLLVLPVIVMTELIGTPMMGRGSSSAWVISLPNGYLIPALFCVLSLWAGLKYNQILYSEIADQDYKQRGEYIRMQPSCAATVRAFVERHEAITYDNVQGLCREIGHVTPLATWVRDLCRGFFAQAFQPLTFAPGHGLTVLDHSYIPTLF